MNKVLYILVVIFLFSCKKDENVGNISIDGNITLLDEFGDSTIFIQSGVRVSSNFDKTFTDQLGNFTLGNSNYTVFSDRNKFRIPDYYRLDLGFNIEGNHKRKKAGHSFWTISIYNVLGRNNPLSVFFVTENGEVKGLKSSVFSVPVPSVTYNLKF